MGANPDRSQLLKLESGSCGIKATRRLRGLESSVLLRGPMLSLLSRVVCAVIYRISGTLSVRASRSTDSFRYLAPKWTPFSVRFKPFPGSVNVHSQGFSLENVFPCRRCVRW